MTSETDDEEDRPDSTLVYNRVLETVRHQTGGVDNPQPPTASERTILTVCCANADLPPEMVRGALKRAVKNDDLFCYQGSTGTFHFCLRDPNRLEDLVDGWADARHAESAAQLLRGFVKSIATADDFDEETRQALVAKANTALQELEGDT